MKDREGKAGIDYLAYLLKEAKRKSNPRAIILLGAGASISAGIPLASQIVEDIKKRYKHNPIIKQFIRDDIKDYYQLMGALPSDERKDLFYDYITDENVKINVTNIYLAQLLKEGYIDYILTVNFDDLILRACGLFNFLPPVYDISNVNLFTTSRYRTKSVTYLYGQYYGQWILNNKDELRKVREDVDHMFKQISVRRTWIVLGYSGQDEIFDHLVKLDSFSNELFWVSYLDQDPEENVMKELINKSNSNANLIKGYDSDSFFLKLHGEIGDLETPNFSSDSLAFFKKDDINLKDKDRVKINTIIDRSIEFPPEYYQAGLNILSFFGTYIREQYPNQDTKIKIEQNDKLVRLIIETINGEKEIIEKALEEYQLIVSGKKKPEEITTNSKLILELKNELRITKYRVETQKEILLDQKDQINQLMDIIGKGLANKGKINIDFKPVITIESNVLNNQNLFLALSDLNELKLLMDDGSPEYIELEELENSIETVKNETDPEVVKKSSAMGKFKKFLEKISDGNKQFERILETTEKGINLIRNIAIKYNSIAEWCGLPVVPKVFTK